MKFDTLKILIAVLIPTVFNTAIINAQNIAAPSDPKYYAMDREQMNFDDYQTLLFNFRGYVSPRQYSITQFTNVHFLPIKSKFYHFNLNFLEKTTGKLIKDDVPVLWEKWINIQEGFDPLGANFRPNSPTLMVTQDEKWQPNGYFRNGTFHKQYGSDLVSFSLKSYTNVSYNDDEVFIQLTIQNRDDEDLELTLIPNQTAQRMLCDGKTGGAIPKKIDAFTYGSEQASARVSSNIETISDQGFELKIPANQKKTYWFAVKFYETGTVPPPVIQKDIKQRMEDAEEMTREKLNWAYRQMPQLTSAKRQFEEYYYRCLLSVLMCRYENPNFISDVFWAVGIWPYTISWDNSYASDVIGMLDPESLKKAILLNLDQVRLKRTYVSWKGAFWDNIYIQEPFALQIMIEAYLRHTGDYSLLDEKAGGLTVWEWMKEWVNELQTNYTNSLGLIDVGYDTQKIIEIRTDGYNHVVPIVNGLTVHLLYQMAEWGKQMEDPKGSRYFKDAERLRNLIFEQLWDEKIAWFNNLYPDGSKEAIWTYHLFDLLGSDYLPAEQVNGLVSHLQDGIFLGEYGLYSIARKDTVHWDLIDSDWGGGGQFCGMPGRVSRYLYKNGFAGKGWDLIRRHMNYIDYFPYLPQNARTDSPHQDRSSMPLQISAGAGMEAIIFGTFGIEFDKEQMSIKPSYHQDIENSILKNIRFNDKVFGIHLENKQFSVYEGNTLIASKYYGEKVIIEKVKHK